jgi:hypothetical protein
MAIKFDAGPSSFYMRVAGLVCHWVCALIAFQGIQNKKRARYDILPSPPMWTGPVQWRTDFDLIASKCNVSPQNKQ